MRAMAMVMVMLATLGCTPSGESYQATRCKLVSAHWSLVTAWSSVPAPSAPRLLLTEFE